MAGKSKDQFGRIRIDVTEKDIEKAVQSDSMACVVTQAIARTIPNANRITTDIQSIRWTDDKGRHVYLTPYAVQGYIVAFDAGDKIMPFSFTLDSRKKLPVKKAVRTPAGRAVTNARTKVRNQKTRQLKIEDALEKDQAAPVPTRTTAAVTQAKKEAAQKVKEAERELVEVTAAYEGQQQFTREGEGAHQAPPRVFKGSRERSYGMRKLRINQPREA